jgi:hypothetical protein
MGNTSSAVLDSIAEGSNCTPEYPLTTRLAVNEFPYLTDSAQLIAMRSIG